MDEQQQTLRERTPFREHPAFPVVYMFGVTLVFAAVLIGFQRASRERVEANRRILFEKAVLIAADPRFDPATPSAEIHSLFVARVEEPSAESAGAYILREGGSPAAYALPFAGQGFWDEIRGVVGIRPDGETLTGVAFFQQNETPGLGAEIVKPYFSRRFEGLELGDEQPLQIVQPGTEAAGNAVQAITGATQTCMRLEDILNDALREWQARRGGRREPS